MASGLEDVDAQISMVLDSWRSTRTGNAIRIASLVLLLWDWVLSFEDERTLFWSKPTTLASYLFYTSRYLAIFVSIFGVAVTLSTGITRTLCLAWFLIEGFAGMTSCWAVEIILQLRVYAIYDQNPKMKRFLISTFFLQVVAIVVIFIVGASVGAETVVVEVVEGPSSFNTRCRVIHVPSWIWFFWVTLASYESLLGALVVCKGFQRTKQSNYSLQKLRNGEGLHEILIRDSVVFYLGIILIYTVNLFLWIQEITDSFDTATGLAVVYPSLMGSHLMFNIRRVHHKSLMNSLVSSPSNVSLPPFPVGVESTGAVQI